MALPYGQKVVAFDSVHRGLTIKTIFMYLQTIVILAVGATLVLAFARQSDSTNPFFQIGQTGYDAKLADFGDALIDTCGTIAQLFK